MEQIELVSKHFCKPDEWLVDNEVAMSQGHLYDSPGEPSGRVSLISLAVGAAALEGYRHGSSLLILPHIDYEAYEVMLKIATKIGYRG